MDKKLTTLSAWNLLTEIILDQYGGLYELCQAKNAGDEKANKFYKLRLDIANLMI